jgi:hypothetical protein
MWGGGPAPRWKLAGFEVFLPDGSTPTGPHETSRVPQAFTFALACLPDWVDDFLRPGYFARPVGVCCSGSLPGPVIWPGLPPSSCRPRGRGDGDYGSEQCISEFVSEDGQSGLWRPRPSYALGSCSASSQAWLLGAMAPGQPVRGSSPPELPRSIWLQAITAATTWTHGSMRALQSQVHSASAG